jgi:glycosyltransferase involved in cell wall biosynthesis
VDCCRAIDPEVIVLEGASWALYHEMLLRAIRKASLRARVWYHSHNVERLLRRSRNGRAIAAVTGWAEGRLLRCADRSFAVSPVDQRHFRELYGVETSLWPNGVDVASFDTVTPQQTQAIKLKYGLHDQLVLFMGLYAYPPNTKAVEFLVKDVFPEVLLQLPDARLVVIGGVVPFRLPWLVNPGIIPHQELPAFIRACDAGVAPLFAGSGTRLKILEYMAARLPVVATTKAAEGIDAKAGAEILIADDAASFAACVAEAAGKSERASAIGDGGYRLVCDRYDWRKITCNRS